MLESGIVRQHCSPSGELVVVCISDDFVLITDAEISWVGLGYMISLLLCFDEVCCSFQQTSSKINVFEAKKVSSLFEIIFIIQSVQKLNRDL